MKKEIIQLILHITLFQQLTPECGFILYGCFCLGLIFQRLPYTVLLLSSMRMLPGWPHFGQTKFPVFSLRFPGNFQTFP